MLMDGSAMPFVDQWTCYKKVFVCQKFFAIATHIDLGQMIVHDATHILNI